MQEYNIENMMEYNINAFSCLGEYLYDFFNRNIISLKTQELLSKIENENPWFTKQNVLFSIKSWTENLKKENLSKFLIPYSNLIENRTSPLDIALIMAGNIPLVGFHDLLCIILSKNKVFFKCSSKDSILTNFAIDFLISNFPKLKDKINVFDDKRTYNAAIATGNNNSAAIFERKFDSIPKIIRKNRNSIAILDSSETKAELELLSRDIFMYYGLGCRSISKIFVKKAYDFSLIIKCFNKYKFLCKNASFLSNYKYQKAISNLRSYKSIPIIDNEFFLTVPSEELTPPIACLYYQFYNSKEELLNIIYKQKDKIQNICGKGFKKFGSSQNPSLDDFSDDIDTMSFLCNL